MSETTKNRPKILVVDDEIEIINFITLIFKKEYQIESALNGEVAKSKMMSFNPDILLTDITMPVLDGYELVKWAKNLETFKNLKILFLSGLGGQADRLKGYEIGADDYITKPFNTQELIAKVKVFVRLKLAEDELLTLNKNLEKQISLRTEQVLQSEKLAVLGRNTAGIIHNLNNPLCAIIGLSALLKQIHPEDQTIDILINASTKMQEIVSGILKTARSRNTARFKPLILNDILSSELNLIENNVFGSGVTVKTNFNKIPDIQGIESDFSQIFGNVIDNAIQAMTRSPTKILTISSSVVNNEICITIEDTGYGISEENLEKIFDPFFTTKPSVSLNGEPTGTGLGMPTCKTMLEGYHGRMVVDSMVNIGTILKIFLPIPKKLSINELIE
jgi:signal transduction histidine kinase